MARPPGHLRAGVRVARAGQRGDSVVKGMPARGERIEPTHEWHQLEFRIRADGQRTYELIRPVVLFGHSPAERAAVWLYGEHLTVEFADEPLARYRVTYQPDKRHLKTVADPHLFETSHRSPQLPLWELGDGEWLTVLRVPEYAPRRRAVGGVAQPPLLP